MSNNETKKMLCEENNVKLFDGNNYAPLVHTTVAVTMAYIPFQTDTTEYTPETALKYGTLFPNLNKPFMGGACK